MPARIYRLLGRYLVVFTAFLIFSTPVAGQPLHPHEGKVVSIGGYARLQEKAVRNGAARLIVSLTAPAVPAEAMSAAEAEETRTWRIKQVQSAVEGRMQGHGMNREHLFEYVPQMVVTADQTAIDSLLSDPDVAAVSEDVPVPAHLDLSVPRIGAPVAWAQGYTGAGVAVAIIDTGVDKTHPFLAGAVISEACYSSNFAPDAASSVCPGGVTDSAASGSAMPYAGICPPGDCDHGTHVAGIAAGRDNGSFSGVAKGASVIAIQVFSRFDNDIINNINECAPVAAPCVMAYPSDIIKGLERAYALRATYNIAAVNMSLGGGFSATFCDTDPRKPVIDNLRAAGIATVISSGNNSFTNGISAPACISSAVSVGATTDSDTVASYSNSASFLSLLAPGSSINSSIPGGFYQSSNGTSMAAPHVTGSWALLKQASPALSVSAGLTALQTTGLNITDSKNGITKRRINVGAAVTPLCLVTVTPSASALFPQAGGGSSFSVSAVVGCAWSATTTSPWITITGGTTGAGNGTITYTVAPNVSSGRSGTIAVGNQTYAVTQAGNPLITRLGLFRGGAWYLDYKGTGSWSGCGAPADATKDMCEAFGLSSDLSVVGDWNGDGKTKIGVFRAGNWYLDYNGTGSWSGCGAPAVPGSDACLTFGGVSSDLPVVGDWNGDGKTKIGVFRAGNWYLDYNGTGSWSGCGAPAVPGSDACLTFGMASDLPVAGDWNGDGKTKIGTFRAGNWYLDYNGNGLWDGCGAPGQAGKDACFAFGLATDIPVTGDWSGDGKTKIGLFRNGSWYLDRNGNGLWDGCDNQDLAKDACFTYGITSDTPLTGLW